MSETCGLGVALGVALRDARRDLVEHRHEPRPRQGLGRAAAHGGLGRAAEGEADVAHRRGIEQQLADLVFGGGDEQAERAVGFELGLVELGLVTGEARRTLVVDAPPALARGAALERAVGHAEPGGDEAGGLAREIVGARVGPVVQGRRRRAAVVVRVMIVVGFGDGRGGEVGVFHPDRIGAAGGDEGSGRQDSAGGQGGLGIWELR